MNVSATTISNYCAKDGIVNGYIWRHTSYEQDEIFENEIWKPFNLNNYDEMLASSLGRIDTRHGNITYGSMNTRGYMTMCIKDKDGNYHRKAVHRLVAEAFHKPNAELLVNHENDNKPNTELLVNHKNGNKADNKPGNLEYVTPSQNVQHAHDTGLTNMSKTYRCVVRIHPDDNDVTGYYDSMTQAAIENNAQHASIYKACNGGQNICAGYKWAYGDSTDTDIQLAINKFKSLSIPPQITEVKVRKHTRPVIRVLKSTIIIDTIEAIDKYYNKIKDAAADNEISYHSICAACSGRQQTAAEFKWFYADKPELKDIVEQYKNMKKL